MKQGSTGYDEPDSEIGLGELLWRAWRARWAILGILFFFALLGAVAGTINPTKYRAEILLSPVTDSPTGAVGGLGELASQYGELASMAGVSLSGRGGNNKDESLATLQSQLITEAYIRENNLLPLLFPTLWDDASKRWKTTDAKRIPTLWMGNQAFKKIRDVKPDKVTGLTTLRITWRDPAIASKWANELVITTNIYLRDKAIKESERNIAYLNQEAARTNIIEAKAAIFSILKDEVNKEMIAKGRDEYALKVIDPAQPPESPSSPSRLLVTLLGLMLGLVLSALLVLSKSFAR